MRTIDLKDATGYIDLTLSDYPTRDELPQFVEATLKQFVPDGKAKVTYVRMEMEYERASLRIGWKRG